MRFVSVIALTVLLPIPIVLAPRAYAIDESVPNEQTLAALVQRANLASPREQCFLYAELVHQMTEQAGRELSSGDPQKASSSIRFVQQYATKIHMGLANDTKRLKNAARSRAAFANILLIRVLALGQGRQPAPLHPLLRMHH